MECPGCGSDLRDGARACLSCGEVVRRKVAPADRLVAVPAGVPAWVALEATPSGEVNFGAARLARILALLVDAVILGIAGWLLSTALGRTPLEISTDGEYAADWRVLIPALVAQAAYYIVFPATKWLGTPGKRLLGLRIVDMDDRPISIFQSVMRFAFQQLWLWVGVPLAVYAVTFSPWAAIFPFVACVAVAVAFWMICANGRSPWDWMAGTKVVD